MNLVKPNYYWGLLVILIIMTFEIPTAWSHARWTQRNETGDWTVALYHFDDEELEAGKSLIDEGSNGLNLLIGEPQPYLLDGELQPAEELYPGKGNYRFLAQALECSSPQLLSATQSIPHPFTLSLEIWLKPLSLGADFRFGFLDGIHVRIRHSDDEGDRFHILGLNSDGMDDQQYKAPGFADFPRVSTWNHYGITIRCPHVQQTDRGTYIYGEGSVARFFYFSHAVGFTGERTLDVSGLELPELGTPGIEVYSGFFQIDEFQISHIDWCISQEYSHGGQGGSEHGDIMDLSHAFEDGRIPGDFVPEQLETTVPVEDWLLY
ncbi:MAG: hypothetical protein JXR73_02820 [Candidatus Omnitrophica bacterium]|nr:hypothetical protein [Candidatus Omnitrophota bacterium]